MKRPRAMWIKLAVIVLGTAAVLALLFLPITALDVTLDVPRSAEPADMEAVGAALPVLVNTLSAAIFVAIVGMAGWLGWRVIRHHRQAS